MFHCQYNNCVPEMLERQHISLKLNFLVVSSCSELAATELHLSNQFQYERTLYSSDGVFGLKWACIYSFFYRR